MSLKIENLKLKINSRGEIATVLTIISVGLMLMGVAVGNVAVQQTTRTQSKANSDSCYVGKDVCMASENNCNFCSQTNCSYYFDVNSQMTDGWQCTNYKKTIEECNAFTNDGPNTCDGNSGCGWMYNGVNHVACGKCVPAGIDPALVCPDTPSAPPPAQPPSGQNKCTGDRTCGDLSQNDRWITLKNYEIETSRLVFYGTSSTCMYASRDADNNCVGACVDDTTATTGTLNDYCRKGSIPAATVPPTTAQGTPANTPPPVPTSPPSSDCVYRDVDECLSFGCKDANSCKSCIQSDGSGGYKCAPSSQTCSQPISCRNKFTNANNNQISQDASGMYHNNATCSGSGYSIESSEIRSYCGVAAAQANSCTSCVSDKCIYHPEIDLRSGRADPGVTQCTDTGCVSDTECTQGQNGQCAKNGSRCGDLGLPCCAEGVSLRCNKDNMCEPIPLPTPVCEDFTTKPECENKCGTRGCEAVPFSGGYAGGLNPNCWRCNTKQYCGKFGNEDCAVGAGKPTPILISSPKADPAKNISKAGQTACGLPIGDYFKGLEGTNNKCVACLAKALKNEDWLNKGIKDAVGKIDNKWSSCDTYNLTQYWCSGGRNTQEGEGLNDNNQSSRDCLDKYMKSGAVCASDCKDVKVNDSSGDSSTTTGNGCSITAPASWKKGGKFDVTATVTDAANRGATATKIIFIKGGIRLKTTDAKNTGTKWEAKGVELDEIGTYRVLFNFTKPNSNSTVECDAGKTITITDSSGTDTNVCNLKVTSDKLPEACATCILNDATTKAKIDSDYPSATYPKCTPDTLVNYWCGKNNSLCRDTMNSSACKKKDICLNASGIQLPIPVLAYSNEDFQAFIDGVKVGKYNALDASLYVTNASRVPGLQRQYCDPFAGQCDFYYQQGT